MPDWAKYEKVYIRVELLQAALLHEHGIPVRAVSNEFLEAFHSDLRLYPEANLSGFTLNDGYVCVRYMVESVCCAKAECWRWSVPSAA